MCNILIHKLQKALLRISQKIEPELFDNLVESILETTRCSICSLWSISNDNMDQSSQHVSLIARDMQNKMCPKFYEETYAHDLNKSFIMNILHETQQAQKTYYVCSKPEYFNYAPSNSIQTFEPHFFIGIPIPSYNDKTKTIAILVLSYIEDTQIEQIELLAKILREFISSTLHNYVQIKKYHIMDDLIKISQKDRQDRDLKSIITNMIYLIRTKHCQCEIGYFYIWDQYNNRYSLLASSGLEGVDPEKYTALSYQPGEGLIGKVAVTRNARIYDYLIDNEKKSGHIERCKELTLKSGITMIVIPLFRSSNHEDVIGILSFINKTNRKRSSIIAPFNKLDIDLISYASNYIALFIDFFLGEEAQNNFISKMSHEIYTPTLAIYKTANRLLAHKEDEAFLKKYLVRYLSDIAYYAEFQKWQTTNNLYLSKITRGISLTKKYYISRCSLKDIIYKSISIIIPIARNEGVLFDNIIIDSNFPRLYLYIDETAFVTVFYNLLTNAIKYHDPETKFYVCISGFEMGDYLSIYITDYGLGILEGDKESIFKVGYRGTNVTQYNNSGLGIGLSVVKQIINDFGGNIQVVNLKSPTKFEITLPIYLLSDNYTKTERWQK